MQNAGLSTSSAGIESLQVTENSDYPVTPEIDDEPYTNATQILPP
jgi:hypothetical protein